MTTALRRAGAAALALTVLVLGASAPAAPAAARAVPQRLYAATSPFNQPLPASPAIHPRSAQIVSRLLARGPVSSLRAGHAGTQRDFGHPVVQAGPSDPVFTVDCVEFGGACPIDGARIRIPDAAEPAGGSDGHLAVLDPGSGWEYDLWTVRAKPRGGGVITIGWGGRTRLRGDGLGAGATAAGFALAAGLVRGPELQANRVDHALAMTVPCTSGRTVWPASGESTGLTCARAGEPVQDAPDLGMRFALRMTAREIGALGLPAWKQALLRAMARHGLLVTDTFGTDGGAAWGLLGESGSSHLPFGLPDPLAAFARRELGRHVETDAAHPGEFIFDLDSGVDWRRRLVVVDA